eukprot:CAMPEP_0206805940 /NCGR_PEP_ID=MMETSP0975-20121206/4476_1 /ASSEMBLY_ACC=CAM_ASM_000399 /TAXON_ID=483370 /ORGANISM="non described non described, Strain CCMP2097" /LENGTH=335 /DNA_ID=CAMNT_0054347997 /DNA_START=16 /DNA_END=1023 /DNA_ORIENTATION=+
MAPRLWAVLALLPAPRRGLSRCRAEDDSSGALAELKAKEVALRRQLASLEAEKKKALATKRLSIGIVGFGKFGQFLASAFARNSHDISVLSRSDRSNEAADLHATSYYSLASEDETDAFVAQDLDVILFAVSILSFDESMAKLGTALAKYPESKPLVVDVLSVKEHPRKIMMSLLPPQTSLLCTHPMFGPESGRYGWTDLAFVYERVRIKADAVDRCERFLSIFESEGCRMVEMNCQQHDVYAANSQFLTHLVGRMLGEKGGLALRRTPIDTKGFESVLKIVETTCDDSFDLFYGLYRYNPNSKSTLLCLRKALADLELRLIELEQAEMRESGTW